LSGSRLRFVLNPEPHPKAFLSRVCCDERPRCLCRAPAARKPAAIKAAASSASAAVVAAPAPAAAKRRPRAKPAASADDEAEEVMSPAVLPKVCSANSSANKRHQEGGFVCPICVCSLLLESACRLLSMTWRTTVDLALRLQEALTRRPRRSCPQLCCPRCAGKVMPSQFQMQERNLWRELATALLHRALQARKLLADK
jgi:hypothetical protein